MGVSIDPTRFKPLDVSALTGPKTSSWMLVSVLETEKLSVVVLERKNGGEDTGIACSPPRLHPFYHIWPSDPEHNWMCAPHTKKLPAG